MSDQVPFMTRRRPRYQAGARFKGGPSRRQRPPSAAARAQDESSGGTMPTMGPRGPPRRAPGMAPGLAAIIEHRRAGLSWAKVADKLNATGHRTRTGGRWTRQVHQARERSHGAAA